MGMQVLLYMPQIFADRSIDHDRGFSLVDLKKRCSDTGKTNPRNISSHLGISVIVKRFAMLHGSVFSFTALA